MQDNTKRANRVLFWMKAIIVIFVVFWLHFIIMVLGVFLLSGDLLALFGGMLFMVLSFCIGVGICMFILLVIFCISYLSWLHRAISNLRLLTTTSFSPMGAVLLTCIPFVGYILNYFIFSDMVKSQEGYMQQRGILKERFPKRILNAWLIASLLLLLIVFVDPNQLGFFDGCFSGGTSRWQPFCRIFRKDACCRDSHLVYHEFLGICQTGTRNFPDTYGRTFQQAC